MKLEIDRGRVARCRGLAAAIAEPVERFITAHSTVSVERAVLRLLGVDGVGAEEAPLPNAVVDALAGSERGAGSRWPSAQALAETGFEPQALGEAVGAGGSRSIDLRGHRMRPRAARLRRSSLRAMARIAARRDERAELLERFPQLAAAAALRHRGQRQHLRGPHRGGCRGGSRRARSSR